MMPEEKEKLGEIKGQVSTNPLQMVWAYQFISDREKEFYNDDNGYLNYIDEVLDQKTAQNIFELIKDGKKYVVQAERFSERDQRLYEMGAVRGYRGFITKVATRRYEMFETPEDHFWLRSPPPPTSWRQTIKDIKTLLKRPFQLSDFAFLLYRQIVARILYLPEINPKHWRY